MKRTVPMLVVLAVVMAAALVSVEAQTGGPTFSAEDPRLNLGEIKAGTEAVATFVFHNNGPDDVRILKAKPS